MKNTGLVLFLCAGLIACGREVPEGFAPVTVKLGASETLATLSDLFGMGPVMNALPEYGGCPGDKINLIVGDNSGMPEIREFLADRISVDANFNPVPVFERKILVPKGPQKIFLVSGQLSEGGLCLATESQHTVGGIWVGDVFEPMMINMGAVLNTEDFHAGSTALVESSLSGSPFVAVRIVNGGSTNAMTVIVKNLSDDTPRSVRALTLAAGSSSGIAPLMPFRKYRISLSAQSVIPTTIFASVEYFTRGPFERTQEVTVLSLPAAVALP